MYVHETFVQKFEHIVFRIRTRSSINIPGRIIFLEKRAGRGSFEEPQSPPEGAKAYSFMEPSPTRRLWFTPETFFVPPVAAQIQTFQCLSVEGFELYRYHVMFSNIPQPNRL